MARAILYFENENLPELITGIIIDLLRKTLPEPLNLSLVRPSDRQTILRICNLPFEKVYALYIFRNMACAEKIQEARSALDELNGERRPTLFWVIDDEEDWPEEIPLLANEKLLFRCGKESEFVETVGPILRFIEAFEK